MVGRERVVWNFEWPGEPKERVLATDSDWGGNEVDRTSTSGGVFSLGLHCVKTWYVTQQDIALSSAEAELYAMVEGIDWG